MRIRSFFIAAALGCILSIVVGAAESKTPELTVAFFTLGSTPKDMKLVQAEINKIVSAEIGATVKFLPINIGAWDQQIKLMLASGERLDLMVTFVGAFGNQVNKGQLFPLDDLIAKNGQGIVASMDSAYFSVAKVGGKLYAVPTVRDFAVSPGVNMRKDVLDRNKIDAASIKTWANLETVLKKVKERESDLVLLAPGAPGFSYVTFMTTWDGLGDGMGVLMDRGASLKVENLFETAEYEATLKRVRAWYKAGLLQKDAATNKYHWASLVQADKLFAYAANIKPGLAAQTSKEAGTPMVNVELGSPLATTNSVASIMWAVPRNSKNPDKAVHFLNLMYSDKRVVNLLDWGIEGKHYVKTADGFIDYPAGVNAKNTGYGLAMGWLFGNQTLASVWKGDRADLNAELADFNSRAAKSKALGFIFNPNPVKAEVAAVGSVMSQYQLLLECGMVDVDEMLPVFIQKLNAAGIRKVIAEKQRQLDAWAAETK